jgi:hypothetical protein
MDIQPTFSFQWLSPLGISVTLFILYGLFYLFIGTLTPIMQNTSAGRQVTVSSLAKDSALLGAPTADLLQTDSALALAGVAVFPFWWLVFRPFGEAGIRVGLDWPPFMLVPTVLLGPALVLGWVGLR